MLKITKCMKKVIGIEQEPRYKQYWCRQSHVQCGQDKFHNRFSKNGLNASLLQDARSYYRQDDWRFCSDKGKDAPICKHTT
jgi:hypothetical protein